MYLGIEIGGTKLQLGLGQGDGRIVRLWRESVKPVEGGEGIRQQILAAVPQLLRDAGLQASDLRGVGIGFGGPVDDATQSVIVSHQITGWESFPLAAWLREKFNVPVFLGNDADVAGLAEALIGAGRGQSPVFYITVGSGIGGGLILDGRIHRGVGRGAAEIGHLRYRDLDGRLDIVEHFASGWGMEREAQRFGCTWTPREIGRLAATDPRARQILTRAIEALAEAICHVITLICPQCVVIGGGVSLLGEDVWFGPLREAVAQRVFRPFAGLTQIVPAALGEEVVVHGALAMARRSSENFTV
jgi:glucokinase